MKDSIKKTKQRLVDSWKLEDFDEGLINAFLSVPREEFVPEKDRWQAYGDYPLSIGYGQTISQPTTVMLMLKWLELRDGIKVLEIGAGSGYNAALIGKIIGNKGRMISVEVVPELAKVAKRNLEKVEVKNVKVIFGDGSRGYEKEAPYDRIVVSCACPERSLKVFVEQLKIGGVLVAPLGGYPQVMTRIRKLKKGKVEREELGDFVFVPLKT